MHRRCDAVVFILNDDSRVGHLHGRRPLPEDVLELFDAGRLVVAHFGRIDRSKLGSGEFGFETMKEALFEDFARHVDVVLDPIGGETQERSWKVSKKGGVLVSLVGPTST